MASISTDKKGNRRILFTGADGKRRPIRLGKMPMKAVEAIRVRVEHLVTAAIGRTAVEPTTARWVADLDARLADKLAAVGLIAERQSALLKEFLAAYKAGRTDVKGATAVVYGHTIRNLIAFFGENMPMRDITPGDADDFRLYLADTENLASNTVNRRVSIAKQFFRAAQRRRLIDENPFADLGASVKGNAAKFYFLSREDADKIIEACPDTQWRLIFALSRFGGLRCPSEHLGLRWADVDLAAGRMLVRSPKTEHHEGKAERFVPTFPELRPYLEDAKELAEDGAEFVITRYRDASQNLRTTFQKIIKRAGLKPWPKLFQNLRSTRETELADEHPAHVVCAWIGNSQAVATKHYLQVTDAHFEQALKPSEKAARKQAQNIAKSDVISRIVETTTFQKSPENTTLLAHPDINFKC